MDWLVPVRVTVPDRGTKVPPLLIQLPAREMVQEEDEQFAVEASSPPAERSAFPVKVRLPASVVVADVLANAICEKVAPDDVVTVVEVAPENVVVALGVNVPAVWIKLPVMVSAVEVDQVPLPDMVRLEYVVVAILSEV